MPLSKVWKPCCVQRLCVSRPPLCSPELQTLSRNYHVHQLSVQPTWKTAVVQKRLKGRSKEFHMELMDGRLHRSLDCNSKELLMMSVTLSYAYLCDFLYYFRTTLVVESWSRPARSQVYQLGNEIHFQVSAFHLPHGAKLYISSCYATPSHDSKSSHKYTIIDNFG